METRLQLVAQSKVKPMPRTKQYSTNAERQKAYRQRKARAKRNENALQITAFSERFRRPILKYPGGKFRLASWILDQFPAHTSYVEPFCGAASVFFRKPPSYIEVLNDLDSDVINFFDVLRSQPDQLVRAIALTPFSREEYWRSFTSPDPDPVEKARLFFVRSWQSFGAISKTDRSGWRYDYYDRGDGRKALTEEWSDIDRLQVAATRLKMALLEHDTAINTINRYDTPETLFYVDPPYLPDTRSLRRRSTTYNHEMTRDDHRELANVLTNVQGMVILSGYPSQVYDELYPGWKALTRTATTNGNSTATEGLWLSPNLLEKHCQLFANLS